VEGQAVAGRDCGRGGEGAEDVVCSLWC
jgi:hypothetical protein